MRYIITFIFPILVASIFLLIGCIALEKGKYTLAYVNLWVSIVTSFFSHITIIYFIIEQRFNTLEAKMKTENGNSENKGQGGC